MDQLESFSIFCYGLHLNLRIKLHCFHIKNNFFNFFVVIFLELLVLLHNNTIKPTFFLFFLALSFDCRQKNTHTHNKNWPSLSAFLCPTTASNANKIPLRRRIALDQLLNACSSWVAGSCFVFVVFHFFAFCILAATLALSFWLYICLEQFCCENIVTHSHTNPQRPPSTMVTF